MSGEEIEHPECEHPFADDANVEGYLELWVVFEFPGDRERVDT